MLTATLLTVKSQAQTAELEWAVVGDGKGQTVLMQNVSFLLASDYDDCFTIVCKDGTSVNGVTKVTFEKIDPTGIQAPQGEHRQRLLLAGGQLTLQGLDGTADVSICTPDGRETMRATLDASHCTLDISRLQRGIYVLRAGKAQVKFIKR